MVWKTQMSLWKLGGINCIIVPDEQKKKIKTVLSNLCIVSTKHVYIKSGNSMSVAVGHFYGLIHFDPRTSNTNFIYINWSFSLATMRDLGSFLTVGLDNAVYNNEIFATTLSSSYNITPLNHPLKLQISTIW